MLEVDGVIEKLGLVLSYTSGNAGNGERKVSVPKVGNAVSGMFYEPKMGKAVRRKGNEMA